MIRRPPRSTPLYSSAASDVYKRQDVERGRAAWAMRARTRGSCGSGLRWGDMALLGSGGRRAMLCRRPADDDLTMVTCEGRLHKDFVAKESNRNEKFPRLEHGVRFASHQGL